MQTILVCDDDRQIVEAIEIYLNGEGYRILKAYDGQEALDLLKDNEVNILYLRYLGDVRRSQVRNKH